MKNRNIYILFNSCTQNAVVFLSAIPHLTRGTLVVLKGFARTTQSEYYLCKQRPIETQYTIPMVQHRAGTCQTVNGIVLNTVWNDKHVDEMR